MARKRILFIIPNTDFGGTSSSLDNLYRFLKDEVDISVFSISKYNKGMNRFAFCDVLLPYDRFLFLFDGIFSQMSLMEKFLSFFVKSLKRLLLIALPQLIDLIYQSRIKKLALGEGYDAVIAFQEGFTTHFSSLLNHNHKIAWIHCNYCTIVPESKSELSVYRRFRTIVCVSNYTANAFISRYPLLANNVNVIYNIFDTDRVKCCVNSSSDVDQMQAPLRLISVGRVDKVKRFSSIPDIADKVCAQGIKIKWTIIGGVSNDVKEGERLQDAINGMLHQNVVEWLGPKDNPCQDMSQANLYVCLSESEACPMVFIESQLLGLPILTTNFGSASEFIKNGYNGYVVPIEEIADMIVHISKNKSMLSEIRSNMRNFRYDNDKIKEKILNLL